MASKKPRIVIVGAGMAGLTAANKLYTSTIPNQDFELYVVEGGNRIGGRINSSEFCGDRIELGATWIHGIQGSPVYRIAQERSLLDSHQPWECMDGPPRNPVTIAEGGHVLDPSFVRPISTLFETLIKSIEQAGKNNFSGENQTSVACFLRKGLEAYVGNEEEEGVGNWEKKMLEEGVFAMHENTHRSYTAADDLETLDCAIEGEYKVFPGEEITIARGYSQVIESLASVLPVGTIQLGRTVEKIEWGDDSREVKLHFSNGTTLSADHVIVTVSLGVLKHRSHDMFDPPLPVSKRLAISRLGFGVADKVFLQLPPPPNDFPCLQMVFHQRNSEFKNREIPDWIRKTSSLYPIYTNSRVVVSWFAGKEAMEMESLSDEEIIDGFSATASNLLPLSQLNFEKVVRSQWGSDPLFLGSYSHVPVGSSGDDMDTLSMPLFQLKILFAGEATHRTHYGTTHGAFISGLREANRLLKHYNISVKE